MVDWREVTISADGTHHLWSGEPLYAVRFDRVLKFHAPGLAPVERGGAAWHIDTDGQPAYSLRYRRTFGFYEERAAAVDVLGWLHIGADGQPRYQQRYRWCGNYQEGRVVVQDDQGFLHLDRQGRGVYSQRWAYAGDYRDGFAVVQGSGGRSTHIDKGGAMVHGVWFDDLDVFHKGYARARDDGGWTHIDPSGRPIYSDRYVMVEPFYNGRARVERADGARVVIDETGQVVAELRPPARSEFHALSADIVGLWRTEVLAVGVKLGVMELLPAEATQVAQNTGLSLDGVARLLRALAELNLVELRGAQWHPTPRGAYLKLNHPETLADAAWEAATVVRQRWAHLEQALRDPSWAPSDIFREVAVNADRRRRHHRMLNSYARHDYTPLVPLIPLGAPGRIVDAGGGLGSLAVSLKTRYPDADVTVIDLPEVVADVVHPGVQTVGADLFLPWPLTADQVLLSRVLHDWDDAAAVRLLQRARAALAPGGQIIVIELVLQPERPSGGLCDLHLRVMTGGRERTSAAFEALFAAAGLRLKQTIATASFLSILVAGT